MKKPNIIFKQTNKNARITVRGSPWEGHLKYTEQGKLELSSL